MDQLDKGEGHYDLKYKTVSAQQFDICLSYCADILCVGRFPPDLTWLGIS